MRRYETMVIVDPDVSEQDRTALFDRLDDLIAAQSGYRVKRDEWGVRKLAYEIRKKPRGYYTRLDFCGSGELVRELERNMRIDDRFLKFMTVLLEEDVDADALKEAAAREEAEKAAAEQEAAPAGEPTGAETPAAAPAEPAGPEPEAPEAAPGEETETEGPEESAGDNEVKEES